MMAINLLNAPLFLSAQWLEENQSARMTAKGKLGYLLTEFGGSYSRGDPEKLNIAGVSVSCTSGTDNLLSAWKRKADAKLNSILQGK
jgi:hypothetical protein